MAATLPIRQNCDPNVERSQARTGSILCRGALLFRRLPLDKFAPDFIDGKWIASLQIGLLAIGGIAFVYGFVRVWRPVDPPELPPAKDRPSAIKGPMAFTEADGDLFRKLGRESELQKLLGLVLDDQVLMVVVRGASGPVRLRSCVPA